MSARVITTDRALISGGLVRTITLSNPSKRNALTRHVLADLIEAMPTKGEVRAMILRGDPAGRAFSSGFDITAIDAQERARGLDPIRLPADTIETCPVPSIALIEDAVFGGALELALACTMRVAKKGTLLGIPPVKLGLVYSTSGFERFARAISPSQMQRLFLTGEPIAAEEAARIGLVDVVDDDAEGVAERWAAQIAQGAPLAVRGTHDAIRRLSRSGGLSPRDIERIDDARRRSVTSVDSAEAVAAFREKREPRFTGE